MIATTKYSTLKQIDIFISSPSDVAHERQITKTIIESLNRVHFIPNGYLLYPQAYEELVPAKVGSPAQDVVNRYMKTPDLCHIVIVVFWSRMGTPFIHPKEQESFCSGTYYEFVVAYKSYKDKGAPLILLYRNTSTNKETDLEQQRAVDDFFKKFLSVPPIYEGLFQSYETVDEFREKVREHLQIILTNKLMNTSKIVDNERINWVEEERRLDAAMPSQVIMGEEVEVWVQICTIDSLGFRDELEDTNSLETELRQDNINNETLNIGFPNPKGLSKPDPTNIQIEVESRDYEIVQKSKIVRVEYSNNSPKVVFLIAPKRLTNNAHLTVSLIQRMPEGFDVVFASITLYATVIKQLGSEKRVRRLVSVATNASVLRRLITLTQSILNAVQKFQDIRGVSANDEEALDLGNIEEQVLKRTDLSRTNLSSANLDGANLSGANLSGANLWGVSLKDADLSNTDMVGTILSDVILTGISLQGIKAGGTDLSQSTLVNVDLTGADLSGANLSGVNLENAVLQGAELQRARLHGANLKNVNLEDANLEAAILTEANLEGTNLHNANLQRASLSFVNIYQADLSNANLMDADLSSAHIYEANLINTNLIGSSLVLSEINNTNFENAKLQFADLSGADLEDTSLKLADLYGARLLKTTLTRVNLDGTRLLNVDLRFSYIKNPIELSKSLIVNSTDDEAYSTDKSELNQPAGSILFDSDIATGAFIGRVLHGYTRLTSITNLQSSNLEGIRVHSSDWSAITMQQSNLQRAVFRSMKLIDVDLQDANLEEIRIFQSDLTGANLERANLRYARINAEQASLFRPPTIFVNANLRKADLEYVFIFNTDLTGVNLESANLRNAKLVRCVLRGVNLRRVNLSNAIISAIDLTDADLLEANLIGVKFEPFGELMITLPDRTNWTSATDMDRFTNPNHPNFWKPRRFIK